MRRPGERARRLASALVGCLAVALVAGLVSCAGEDAPPWTGAWVPDPQGTAALGEEGVRVEAPEDVARRVLGERRLELRPDGTFVRREGPAAGALVIEGTWSEQAGRLLLRSTRAGGEDLTPEEAGPDQHAWMRDERLVLREKDGTTVWRRP